MTLTQFGNTISFTNQIELRRRWLISRKQTSSQRLNCRWLCLQQLITKYVRFQVLARIEICMLFPAEVQCIDKGKITPELGFYSEDGMQFNNPNRHSQTYHQWRVQTVNHPLSCLIRQLQKTENCSEKNLLLHQTEARQNFTDCESNNLTYCQCCSYFNQICQVNTAEIFRPTVSRFLHACSIPVH